MIRIAKVATGGRENTISGPAEVADRSPRGILPTAVKGCRQRTTGVFLRRIGQKDADGREIFLRHPLPIIMRISMNS